MQQQQKCMTDGMDDIDESKKTKELPLPLSEKGNQHFTLLFKTTKVDYNYGYGTRYTCPFYPVSAKESGTGDYFR